MSGCAHDRAVTDPLVGVLRDAWHLYRASAAPMLVGAPALYGALATFLLIVVVAAPPSGTQRREGPDTSQAVDRCGQGRARSGDPGSQLAR
jgi:hypothetical protein